jgi:hypothetical protein
MSRARLRRMTPADFDATRALLPNVSDERAAVAREALVEGKTNEDIGARHKCTPQAVDTAVRTFWKKQEDYRESQRVSMLAGAVVPPGWEVVTLIAPSALVKKFRAEVAALGDGTAEQKTKGA